MTTTHGQTTTGDTRAGLVSAACASWASGSASCPSRPDAVRENMGRIDEWIAKRVKQARVERGLSQEGLAEKLGISLQQIHKYEAGRNRISATRLAAISHALSKPLDEFFEGLEDAPPETSGEQTPPDRGRECLELVRNFEQITDPTKRRALVDFLQALSGTQER